MKICRNCTHCIIRNYGRSMWDYLCGHPDLEHPKTTNPVTGNIEHYTKNNLEQTCYTSEPHPYCGSINIEGECEHYEGGQILHRGGIREGQDSGDEV